jgi:YVTN family beta-propeller protein
VVKRIAVGKSPRGLLASPDSRLVYVADGLDDTISVIDVARQERVSVIDLGGPKEITKARYGSQVFHSANITFQNQFSCHSCHPDGHVDGITYDIEPDGIGINPVDNRSLRGIFDTAPFKWEGTNPSLKRQCGPRLAVFFTRIDPFTPEDLDALDHYITTIPRPPNRYRTLGEDLTPPQRRGKAVYERVTDNLGMPIPERDRCNFCHSGAYFTNARKFDVGTSSPLDTHSIFDVPHLNNIYDSSPFLHDGRAHTLEEIWTVFNPHDKHGITNDMTKDQLNDLIEYIKTL